MFFEITVVDLSKVKKFFPRNVECEFTKCMKRNGRFLGDRYYLMEGDVELTYPSLSRAILGSIYVDSLHEREVSDDKLLNIITQTL